MSVRDSQSLGILVVVWVLRVHRVRKVLRIRRALVRCASRLGFSQAWFVDSLNPDSGSSFVCPFAMSPLTFRSVELLGIWYPVLGE